MWRPCMSAWPQSACLLFQLRDRTAARPGQAGSGGQATRGSAGLGHRLPQLFSCLGYAKRLPTDGVTKTEL